MWIDGRFCTVYRGTVVGYQHILEEVKTAKLRVRILDARVSLNLAFFGGILMWDGFCQTA